MNYGLRPAPLAFLESEAYGFPQKAGAHILGFEFDGTACFRKGTRFGPNALRTDSHNIESYSPYLDADTSDLVGPFDLGNLPVGNTPEVERNWQQACDSLNKIFDDMSQEQREKFRLITLGGEHSISYTPITQYLKTFPDLVLIHLDAHADLRDGYEGHYYSHASVLRRVLDHFGTGHDLIQYGIRSGTKGEFQWMKEHKTLCQGRAEFLERVQAISDERPIYLTLDLDYFDPCFMPGTGTPEAGGEDFHSFISLVKKLSKKNFVGADIVELSPPQDTSGNSSVFAAKVVREITLALNYSEGKLK